MKDEWIRSMPILSELNAPKPKSLISVCYFYRRARVLNKKKLEKQRNFMFFSSSVLQIAIEKKVADAEK